MAVIEIAKIQIRRGQEGQVGMPQLDSGEFGWAIDTQTLYIGNGSVDEGAPAVGNTEVVTANNISNFFNIKAAYNYGSSAGTPYSVVGTFPINNTVTRTVAGKLDDFVNVIDFGAIADWNGTSGTDNTAAFQAAIYNIYLQNPTNSISDKPLRIPAGRYYFSSTVYIPPNVTIVGDGPDKTILVTSSANANLLQLCDGTSLGYGNNPYIVFIPGQNNITSSGRPQNIHIEGMTLSYSTAGALPNYVPLLSLDCATNSQIINCKFAGTYNAGNIANSDFNNQYDGYVGIDIRSQGNSPNVVVTEKILIENCVFSGLKYGIKSTYDCYDIIINNNIFEILNRGINWAPSLAVYATQGPFRSRITSNIFNNIYNEGIYVGGSNGISTDHVSSFNSFNGVGIHLSQNGYSDLNAATPVIRFLSPGNVSIEDKFYRDDAIKKTSVIPTLYLPNVAGKNLVNSNVAYTATLVNSPGTSITLVNIPYASNDQMINLQYLYSGAGVSGHPQSFVSRKGSLSLGISSIIQSATVTDNFTYSISGGGYDPEPLAGLQFTASLNTITNYINISYTGAYLAGTIEYQYNYIG